MDPKIMEILNRKDAKYSPQDLIDVFSIVMNRGVEIGKEHNSPSPATMQMFGEMNKKLDSIHSALYGIENNGGLIKQVESIESQTKKTNGRVTKMELWKFGLTAAYTAGVGIIMFFVIYFAIPSFNYQIAAIAALDKQVTTHIAQDSDNFKSVIKK